MTRSTRRNGVSNPSWLWSAAFASALLAASPALAQLGGGNKPQQPAQPAQAEQPASQDGGVRVAPSAPPQSDTVRRTPPPISAEPGKIDVGVLRPGEKRSASVMLTNNGTEPITIARVNSSCSCTVADLPKRDLAPGESVELSATLEAGNYIGPMQRQVRVYVAGYAPPYEVWVTADVSYDIKADPVFIGAFQGDNGEVKVTEIHGKPFRVLSVNGNPATFKDFNEGDALRAEYTLTWTTKGVDPKDLPSWWIVETDHPTAPVVDLRLLHPAVLPKVDPRRAWSIEEDRALIGYLKPGETRTLSVDIKERRRSEAEHPLPEVSTKHEHLKAEVVKLERTPDGYTLEISLSGTPAGDGSTLIHEPITIKWRDSQETYWVFGRLTEPPAGASHASR